MVSVVGSMPLCKNFKWVKGYMDIRIKCTQKCMYPRQPLPPCLLLQSHISEARGKNKGEKRANSSTKVKAKVISTTVKKNMSKTKQKC